MGNDLPPVTLHDRISPPDQAKKRQQKNAAKKTQQKKHSK